MSNKYLLLMVIIFHVECHSLAHRILEISGKASLVLIRKHALSYPNRTPLRPINNPSAALLFPEPIQSNALLSEIAIPSTTEALLSKKPDIVKINGLSPEESAFIDGKHPKFKKRYLDTLNSTAKEIERSLYWSWKIIEHKTEQLEKEYAELFEKMTNKHGRTIRDLIKEFKETGAPFESLEALYRLVESRFRPEPLPL